jgi:hypothetical protein
MQQYRRERFRKVKKSASGCVKLQGGRAEGGFVSENVNGKRLHIEQDLEGTDETINTILQDSFRKL